jgi:hypothetical protein
MCDVTRPPVSVCIQLRVDDVDSWQLHYALCVARFGPGVPGLYVSSHMFVPFDVVNGIDVVYKCGLRHVGAGLSSSVFREAL